MLGLYRNSSLGTRRIRRAHVLFALADASGRYLVQTDFQPTCPVPITTVYPVWGRFDTLNLYTYTFCSAPADDWPLEMESDFRLIRIYELVWWCQTTMSHVIQVKSRSCKAALVRQLSRAQLPEWYILLYLSWFWVAWVKGNGSAETLRSWKPP